MLKRIATDLLHARLRNYPAVSLLGPRQCGKTTLARSLGGQFFDLEHETDITRLQAQWDSVVSGKGLVIFDEAQNWPPLFKRLRVVIDADRSNNGRFLLLGSVSPVLMINVSESLAGRLSLLDLTPFLLPELETHDPARLWLFGGYPDGGILNAAQYPHWQESYLSTLVQRDLPLWGLPSKPQTTNRFLRMLASINGQLWNANQIGQSMGLNHVTINSYLDYLVGAFLIRRLEPYHVNIGKRLSKTPKIYWRDTGLLHSLLNVSDAKTLLEQAWVGASWEGFVIEQIISILTATGRHFNAYHFRTSDQKEIDLVLDFGHELWAIEIKLTTEPSNDEMRRLNATADLIKAKRRFLVSQTKEFISGNDSISCGLGAFLDLLLSEK